MKYGYGEMKNVRNGVRLRRRKKRLSEVWPRRSEKRFERSEATEKKKAREQQLENEEENSVCFFFVSNHCVFVWLKLQEREKKNTYSNYKLYKYLKH